MAVLGTPVQGVSRVRGGECGKREAAQYCHMRACVVLTGFFLPLNLLLAVAE